MIEVFRTNVKKRAEADMLIQTIERAFPGTFASFDLEDCDRVLRIDCTGALEASCFIELINNFGFDAEILTDEIRLSFDGELQDLLSSELASR